MLLSPFDHQGRMLRGNLHGHCDHSDGVLSAQRVTAAYRRLGYDFTCLTDHLWSDSSYAATSVNDTRHLDSNDFITIISAELHCPGKSIDSHGLWHIVANGLPLDFAMASESETGPQMVQRALDAGAFVTSAHPEWYSLTSDEAASLAHAHAVEIYNHTSTIRAARGSGVATADYLLNRGHRVLLTASDDSHFEVDDAGGGWVMVAATLDQAEIVTALKAGRYYSSSGATINAIELDGEVDGDRVTISCSPAHSVVISGAGHQARAEVGTNITKASFDLGNLKSDWFRVTIVGAAGCAWSNPYWLADYR